MNESRTRYPVEEHRRFAAETRCGAIVVTNILESWLDFRTVLDLGCGTGTWLRVMRAGGRRQVFGVDREGFDPADLEVDPDLVLTADLGRRLALHQRYDLVVCLEVAEHIDAQFADAVVDNCVRHGDLVLFSAALPGQQGFQHINEQPPRYWAERFQRHGYVVLDLIRPLIWDDPQIPVWYRQNILLYAKDGSSQLEALRAKAAAPPSVPLALAHPEYMRWFSTQAQIATAEADAARQRLTQAQADFEASLARHRDSEVQARSALEAALADAARQREAESAARKVAEAAAADLQHRYEAAEQARAAAETALAEAMQSLAAETASRSTAEAALGEATRAQQAASETRIAAEAALADAVQGRAAEAASRAGAEAALAEATDARQAEHAARTAAETLLAEATRAQQAEHAARTAAEAALAEATRAQQAEYAARTVADAALAHAAQTHATETASRLAAEAALAEATRALQAESEAREAAETALADAVQRHAAEMASRLAAEAALAEATAARQAESDARFAVEAALAEATRTQQAESEARSATEAALAEAVQGRAAETASRLAAEAALAVATAAQQAESEARMAAEAALAGATRTQQAASDARSAIEAALAEAVQSRAIEAASRLAAEAALAVATAAQQAESEARTAAETALAEAVHGHAAETASRLTAEAALAEATRARQAESAARTAAETALAEAVRRQAAEAASRLDAEAALAEATRARQAASEVRAAAEGALAHAVHRCNAETTARVAAEAGLTEAARRLQVAAAERAQIQKTLDDLRDGQQRAVTALATARLALQMEAKATAGSESALAEAMRQHDAELQARIAGSTALAQTRQDLAAERIANDAARDAHAHASAELATARSEIAMLRWERGIILGSTLWVATEPLRRLGRAISSIRRQRLRRLVRVLIPRLQRTDHPEDGLLQQRPAEAVATPQPAPVEPVAELYPAPASAVTVAAAPVHRVMVISGEPHTPGHVYRVARFAAAASATGAQVTCLTIAEAQQRLPEITVANVVMIWRARASAPLRQIIAAVREGGARLVYDLDDLMFKPELARLDIVDGIRTMRLTTEEVAAHFSDIRDILVQADVCTCTTEELANHIREYQKVAVVLPNGFAAETLRAARRAVRRRQSAPAADVLRIGYASGSRTHQRDFAQVADALVRVLAERPSVRLVLFRDADSKEPVLLIDEFPALRPFADQVEWRDMVPAEHLPGELARFDINLAPVELDNVFCEAKSELKYFEAAIVGVCTIASPTGPFRRAIRPGETGLLAGTSQEWYAALIALIDDAGSREALAHAAYLDVLWRYGPQQRIEQVRSLLEQLAGGRGSARAFQLELARRLMPRARGVALPDRDVVFRTDVLGEAEVTVAIPLHNYGHYVIEALESVRAQTLPSLDLVVVDDASTDDSLAVTLDWVRLHAERFNRVVVVRNGRNAGLGVTRNAGFDAAETPYVLPLDADNRLRPTCCAVCLDALRGSGAAFAYPSLQHFGDSTDVIGIEPFQPMRFVSGNYIDAMALVAKPAWAAVGGYDDIRPNGWDDYELWCSFVERGLWGVHVPQILAEYRVHTGSMLRTLTDERANKLRLIGELERRHPWLTVLYGE